jgi:hypothetical protein
MSNVMIDIETLSTTPNSIILSIAAVKFNSDGPLEDNFFENITIQSCIDLGLDKDIKTEQWWEKQSVEIKNRPNQLPIGEVMSNFITWIVKMDTPINIWANSPSFDCVIIKNTLTKLSIPIPWNYWDEKDVRTLLYLANIKPWELPNIKKHNPLYDCYRQIIGVNRSITKLGLEL